jgi:hypothetical protein
MSAATPRVDPDVDPAPPSIIDGLGHEVLAVVAPVAVCIGATVCLVRVLNPDGAGSGAGVYWAAAAYKEDVGLREGRRGGGGGGDATEQQCRPRPPLPPTRCQAGDSTSTKVLGSLENASIFVAFVTATTFALVALFKRGRTRAIAGYMALSSFSVFFFLTGGREQWQRWRCE